MLSTVMDNFLQIVMESSSLMSVELILAALSAVVYFMFSSRSIRKTNETLSGSSSSDKNMGPSSKLKGNRASNLTQTKTTNTEDAAHVCKRMTMRSNDIRSCGRNGNLNGALKVFEKLVLAEEADNTLVLNSMLDACVECQDLAQATEFFNRARRSNLADSITYNRMMKGLLAQGKVAEARDLLKEAALTGIANTTTYHGLVNACVNAGDMRGAWKIVSEMQKNQIKPNAVTCAILLKGKLTSTEEVSRVLFLVDAMEEDMDEVLFVAVAEACVRVGRLDMLSKQMEKFQRQGGSGVLSPETYGSMIKAYGRARDTTRVWELWTQMATDNTRLTSVTLGCMVEALVANGQSTEARELVQNILKDEETRPLVNTVICSSILKGFAQMKDTEKVMGLYKEMKTHKIQPNTITFNTILNAFAQCGTMQHAPQLLEDMKETTPPVEPDIVTYSTLVKGFCYVGSLDRALKIFRDMQKDGKCAPDEVLFNSLLGGCAKEFRLDEALSLLSDMRKCGIAPSNYTLSMLVKLMCRCRRLEQAFTMLEDISKEYNFKINIQVYTCLIQGCFHNGCIDKALTVYDKIMNEKLLPDAMTYTVLVRGCLRAGNNSKAAELVRHANGIGLESSRSKAAPPGVGAGCLDDVVAALGGPESKEGVLLLMDVCACSSAAVPVSNGRQAKQWDSSNGRPAKQW